MNSEEEPFGRRWLNCGGRRQCRGLELLAFACGLYAFTDGVDNDAWQIGAKVLETGFHAPHIALDAF